MSHFIGMLALLLAVAPLRAATLDTAGAVAESSRYAAATADLGSSRSSAGQGFDNPSPNSFLSPPLVSVPVEGTRRPGADLVVGQPDKRIYKEPGNPLTEEGKAKPQKSGQKLWWTAGGAALGAGLGFLLAGPIGAAVGGLLGALAGWFFGP